MRVKAFLEKAKDVREIELSPKNRKDKVTMATRGSERKRDAFSGLMTSL